jgi:PAS domain S-box-containing protein
MHERNRASKALAELRKTAEKRLQERGSCLTQADRDDLDRIVYELEVHQTELEIQNEELRRSQKELEKSRDDFADLYESAPVAYVTLNAQGTIERANEAAQALLGSQNLRRGAAFLLLIDQRDRFLYENFLNEHGSARRPHGAVELRLAHAGTEPVMVQLQARTKFDEAGEVAHRLLILQDITERKRSEEERERLLAELQTIMENMAEAVVLADPEGKVIYHNPASLELHGYRDLDEALLPREDVADRWECLDLSGRRLALEDWPMPRVIQGERLYRHEVVARRKDGGLGFVGSYSGTLVRRASGEPMLALLVIHDVTESKRIEEERRKHREELEGQVRERTRELESESNRRRYLAKRLVDVLETDRRNLSMMLHDDIGQSIAGTKMAIENLKTHLNPSDPQDSKQFDRILEALQSIMASLRETSRELRPVSLDQLGLASALRALDTGDPACRIRTHIRGVPEDLDGDLELSVFRIAQEAITNAVRHAGCREIHLSLTSRDTSLVLMVEDDGCGFEWDASISSSADEEGPLGLLIMRERAANVGGRLHVDSVPARGTTLIAEFPLKDPGFSDPPP